MDKPSQVADHRARTQALVASRSFVVQAPAGSEKRSCSYSVFLYFWQGAEVPERDYAITFTRKAAGEMRDRMLHALESARSGQAPRMRTSAIPGSLHAAALTGNRSGLELLDNPARFRIQTIDALCASLSRQMPVLSRFGACRRLSEMHNRFTWKRQGIPLGPGIERRMVGCRGNPGAAYGQPGGQVTGPGSCHACQPGSLLRHIVGRTIRNCSAKCWSRYAHRITDVLGI